MIYIGTLSAVDAKKAMATVNLPQIDQKARCHILQPATGDKRFLNLPNVGDQVAVWCTEEANLLLGALYAENDPIPSADLTLEAPAQSATLKLGGMSIDLGDDGQLELKNAKTSLQSLFNDLANLLQKLTVETPTGLGKISTETITQITIWKNKLSILLK